MRASVRRHGTRSANAQRNDSAGKEVAQGVRGVHSVKRGQVCKTQSRDSVTVLENTAPVRPGHESSHLLPVLIDKVSQAGEGCRNASPGSQSAAGDRVRFLYRGW